MSLSPIGAEALLRLLVERQKAQFLANMNLRLFLVSSGYDPVSRRWTLDIQDREGKIMGTTWVADPFTALEEENLAWYLEKFAIDDPFARGRATVVAESLSSYKHALAAAIEPLLLQTLHGVQLDSPVETITLGIRDFEKEERSINALLWELLEDQQSWKELTIPVLFFRFVKTTANPPRNPNVPSKPQSFYNVLLVSARPGLKKDLPYRLISKPILGQSDIPEAWSRPMPQSRLLPIGLDWIG